MRLPAIVLAAALMAAPAAAQTASAQAAPGGAPASRRQQLATELMAAVFSGGFMETAVLRGMQEEGGAFATHPWARPEWKALMEQAALEELRHDAAKIQRIFGRQFAAGFSEAELEAGLAVMRTTGGRKLVNATAAGTDAMPDMSTTERVELLRAFRSPAAQSFAEKMGDLSVTSETKAAMMAELFPGMMRRFGEKAEALQGR